MENKNEEPIYLNYGEDQINQTELMDSLANNYESYLNSKRWGKKKKYREKWLNAYQDILNRGITGASSDSGIWKVNHNGENINLDGMSNIDKEMYQDAAYFIKSQMSRMTPKTKEEKKDNKDIPLYDYTQHTNQFNNYLNNSLFGGRSMVIGGENDDWNILDERDQTTGIRGTTNRANKLASVLEGYMNSLEDNKYSFEGSPYGSLEELKGKLSNAITSLRSGVFDQNTKDALNQIGLDWRIYFNDGSGDVAGVDSEGNQYTYAQLAERNQLIQDQKDKEEAAKLLSEQKANRGVLNKLGGIHAVEAANQAENYSNWLANTYKTGQEGFNNINSRIQSLLEKGDTSGLTGADKKELGNLLYYIKNKNPNYQGLGNGQKTNISDNEWKELLTHNNLGSQNKNDFIRLPWQTPDGRYTYADNQGNIYYMKPSNKQKFNAPAINRSKEYYNYKNNFLKSPNKLKDEQLAVNMNTPISQMKGFSPEMKRELQALAWDLGAFIDPEAVSGTAMALRAAHLREQNRPEGWSWEKVLDWGTAAMGGLPVLGDLLSVGKPLYRLGQLIKNSTQFVGYLSTAFGAIGATQAIEPLKKLATSPTSLTPQDVQNLAYGLMGLAGGVKTVRAARAGKAYEQAKKGSQTTEHSIEIQTKDGKTSTIKLNDEEAKAVANEYKSAKNNKEANDKVISMASIKEKAKNLNIDLTDAKLLNGAGRLRGSKVGRMVTSTKSPVRTKSIYNSESPVQFDRGWSWTRPFNPIRANIIDRAYVPQENNTPWYKKLNNFIFGDYTPKPVEARTNSESSRTTTNSTNTSESSSTSNNREQQFDRAVINRYRDMLKGKFSNKKVTEGNFKFGDGKDISVNVKKSPSGQYDIYINGKRTEVKNDLNETEVKKEIASLVQNYRKQINNGKSKNEKISTKDIGKLLQDLKRKGWLRYGGTIDKQRIQRYKEFINK